ncbi:2'-5' RNA ligase family protein [Variovorax sp. 54]|uniref:2'-5' RNA ligase family protein n=1 Tax=Variovorax sp. 54 TaxID=2035212 RepID=UPI00211E0537|nr:2'-5' RNA ligase family protein [Variovorax sp. 54]
MHLTLHCFGDQTQPVEKRLRDALARVPVQPMELMLDRSCTWNNHIAVVQPAEHAGLHALYKHISHAVQQAGILTGTPKFTPHITIARKAASAAYPRHMPPIPWCVKKFLLVRSFTGASFRHEVLASYEAQEDAHV